jgi:DNA-binding GntR family transcriptional regulator
MAAAKSDPTSNRSTSATPSQSRVDQIYHQLRQMAMNYQFRPGEPLNEVELAASFGVSRTPLREVLNRLVAEGLLNFVPRRGFSCPALDRKMVIDLYEVRSGLEAISARLATVRASDSQIDQLVEFWQAAMQHFPTATATECAQYDEQFHEHIARLSGNAELLRMLQTVNARIHYLRLISMEQEAFRRTTCAEHQAILQAIQQRHSEAAAASMTAHVNLRQDQLVDMLKEGIARLYLA